MIGLIIVVLLLSICLLLYFWCFKSWLENRIISHNKSKTEPYHLPRYPETNLRGFRVAFYWLSFAIAVWLFGLLLIMWQLSSGLGWGFMTQTNDVEEWQADTVEVVLLPPPPTPQPPTEAPKMQSKPNVPKQKPIAPKPKSVSEIPIVVTDNTPINNPKPRTSADSLTAANGDANNNNNPTSNKDTSSNTTPKPLPKDFMTIDQYPRFPGGEDALISYLHNNIKYPPNAREKGLEGTVYIGCEIKEDGSIGIVTVKKDIANSGFAQESVRVVKTMPKWTPAQKDGKAIKSFIYLPIQFDLQ